MLYITTIVLAPPMNTNRIVDSVPRKNPALEAEIRLRRPGEIKKIGLEILDHTWEAPDQIIKKT